MGISFHEENHQRWVTWLPGFIEAQGGKGPVLVLLREPDNPHDPNAIGVHLPMLDQTDAQIGHVPRDLAAWLAPQMDAGHRPEAWVSGIIEHPDHPDNPGLHAMFVLHPPPSA